MNNTMTAHEPINYLDSILKEEEMRCEYSHEWRNFTISRSGRYKSKNKKRDVVDGQLFDASAAPIKSMDECSSRNGAGIFKENDKISTRQPSSSSTKSYQQASNTGGTGPRVRGKMETYKSYYETNL